jgi:amidohydrolase
MLQKIKQLRKELHQNPELSEQEVETAARIRRFVEEHHNTQIIDQLGGTGLAVVYDFPNAGPTVMIRCELDALPIVEANSFDYKSNKDGVSHKCGHDGHMAIVAGLIFWIKEKKFQHGKIILLFQPAEELGTGAFRILKDPEFEKLRPDYIFALHNIPGNELNSIITVKNKFSATVQSIAIQLTGKESHSAQPEKGVNPALCMAELIQTFDALNLLDKTSDDFTIFVPIYSSMGKKSYGISAGFGEIHYTARTWNVEKMEALKVKIDAILLRVTKKYQLTFSTNWFDFFPTVVNDEFCNALIEETARRNKFKVIQNLYPYSFGEDFGWFSQKYKVAMFGLGAGIHVPALHHADYDFPEEIIETGMDMFKGLIESVLRKKRNNEAQRIED